MPQDALLRRGRIVFIDDDASAVQPFISQLRREGFTNTTLIEQVDTLADVTRMDADLLYLDITGVATTLDAEREGLAVLDFVKRHSPATRVVVLSGSEFPADTAASLATADICVRKATLGLADMVALTEEQLRLALAPETRNPAIVRAIAERQPASELGFFERRKLQKAVQSAANHAGDPSFDWGALIRNLRALRGVTSEVVQLVGMLSDGTAA